MRHTVERLPHRERARSVRWAGADSMTLKSQTRAAEYHAKASEAAALATSSVLLRVRELHELAACRWTHLAELEDRRSVSLAGRYGRAALRKALRPSFSMRSSAGDALPLPDDRS